MEARGLMALCRAVLPSPSWGGSGDPIPILLALGATLDPSCVAAV